MLVAIGAAIITTTITTIPARADPLPGFALDPAVLEQRMDACMAYTLPAEEILMGWVRLRDGARRHWRCESLRHMLLDADDRPNGEVHDPYVNVGDFMRCTDAVVTGGLPRAGGKPEYTAYIKQYNGTAGRAIVLVNTLSNDDIVTIHTEPVDNEWTACANAL